MENASWTAWIVAAVVLVFLVASFTGSGTGPWGLGSMTHMAWSYMVLLLLAFALIAIALARSRPA